MSKRGHKRKERQDAQRAKQRDRQARAEFNPRLEKSAVAADLNFDNANVTFDFTRFDYGWLWGSRDEQHEDIGEICEKLKGFHGWTWSQLYRHRDDHPMPATSLCREAQERLAQLELGQETDTLFRLRFSPQQRLWGIKVEDRFCVIWWDPKHQVYPMDIADNMGGVPRTICSARP